MKIIRVSLLIGLMANYVPSIIAAGVDTLDLAGLLKQLDTNPQLELRRASIASKAARLEIVQSEKLPQLKFSVNGDLVNTTDKSRTFQGGVEYNVYDWGGLRSTIESAKSALDSETIRADAKGLELKLSVIKSYISAWGSHKRELVMLEGLATSQGLRDVMQRRVNQRVNPASDLLIVDSRIAQLNSSAVQYRGETRDAQLDLLQLTDHKADITANLECKASLNEMLLARAAKEKSPHLASARANSHSVRAEFGAVDAKRFPAIVAGVALTSDLETGENDTRVFISLRYSYFLGNRLEAELAELEAEYAASQFEEDRIAQEVVREAAGLVNQYQVNSQQIPILLSIIELRTQQLASHTRRFVSGKSTWHDLMGAERDLVEAKLSEIEARSNACLALLSLEQITGRTLNEF